MFSKTGSLAMSITKTPYCRIAVLVIGALLICACKPKNRVGTQVSIVTPTPTFNPIPNSTPEATPTATGTPNETPTPSPTVPPIATAAPTPSAAPAATLAPSPIPTAVPSYPSEGRLDLTVQSQSYSAAFDLTVSSAELVTIEETQDPLGGIYNISNIEAGEWLEYAITIPRTANLLFDARVASLNGGGQFNVLIDGVERGNILNVGATGGWQSWGNVSTDLGQVSAGMRTIRIQVIAGGFNFNWFRLIEGEGEIDGRAWLPSSIASASAIVQPVLTGLNYSEGLVADDLGHVYFSEFGGEHKIWQINTTTGMNTIYRNPSNYSTGLGLDASGRLLSAERGGIALESSLGSWSIISSSPTVDASHVSVGSDGDLFFTDASGGSIYYLDSSNNRTQYGGFNQPKGLAWDTTHHHLYVALSGDNTVIRFDVDPLDASLSNQQIFAAMASPSGLALDQDGNLYAASFSEAAIHVFHPEGGLLGTIEVDADNVSHCAFGGGNRSTLYISGHGGLRQIPLKIPGHTPFN